MHEDVSPSVVSVKWWSSSSQVVNTVHQC